ncbi:SDR family oxidoreductase [Streptomyces sp. LZ34]
MILVTGATGNIGSALLKELRTSGAGPLRGLTRDAARSAFPAGAEAVEGDFSRVATLKPALDGVRALFLPSRMGPDADILDVARQAGVEHVVLVSSITVQTHPHLGPAEENLAVERLLQDSGMAWTILRPTQFASNALWWAEAIRERQTTFYRLSARNRVWLARRNLPRVLIPFNLVTWVLLTLWRVRDRAALRVSLTGFKEGLRGGHGSRSPMSWHTVARLARAGRAPIL